MQSTHYYILFLAAVAFGCARGRGHDHAKGAPPPVARTAQSPLCIISADCPAGQHCDLGECIQECNSIDPCTGELVCSPRARCLAPEVPDEDPPPDTTYSGTVAVSPLETRLTSLDSKLELTLTSTSDQPVRYRVQVNAPYLSIAEPRGEFTGKKTLELQVDASQQATPDVAGNVRVVTTLGTVVTATSLHLGLTGRYHGSLRYDVGPVALGDARLGLELVETNGDVNLHIDPAQSLLFPTTPEGDAYGFGNYVPGAGLELTVEQVVDGSVGGTRNHFGRSIGRRLRLHLDDANPGVLKGTFDETLYGMFVNVAQLQGHVELHYVPGTFDVQFRPPVATMPAAPTQNPFVTVDAIFRRKPPLSPTSPQLALQQWHLPLLSAMAGGANFADLRPSCEYALALPGANPVATANCGDAVGLAAMLQTLAQGDPADAIVASNFGAVLQAVFAPAALVAQDHMVDAVRTALDSGNVPTEKGQYDRAIGALGPVATLLLQPGMLEFMRGIAPKVAAVPPDLSKLKLPDNSTLALPNQDTQLDGFPVARAMAKTLRLLSELDGERSRLLALDSVTPADDRIPETQARAVVTFLESAALLSLLGAWQPVPPTVGAGMLDLLRPLDASFGALLAGADALGIPNGYVPFVYRDDNPVGGPSNFEQVSAMAKKAIDAAMVAEKNFHDSARSFDTDQYQLADEQSKLNFTYADRLASLCGADFQPEAIKSPEDWSKCGSSGGEVYSLRSAFDQAQAGWNAAQGRIQAQSEKIQIDRQALADKQNVHSETLQFIDDTGQDLANLAFGEGCLDAVSQMLNTSSNAQLFNAGAPGAMGAASFAVGMIKATMEAEKQRLQTAQQMRFEQASATLELIDGMANIQRQIVDREQMTLEIAQNVLEVTQKQMEAQDKLEEAKRVYQQRAQALALAGKNPLRDPAFRVVRDHLAHAALAARGTAQVNLMFMARALAYEVNRPLEGLDGAVMAARTGADMSQLANCMTGIFDQYISTYGDPQEYVTTVSLREMLGITGPRTDDVTGQELSPGEQFRMVVLRNENLTDDDSVRIKFSTDLAPGNGLWSTDVCNDRITKLQAQLVGDFLGDNEAEIRLAISGAAVQRACDSDELRIWSIQAKDAVIQAGVNTFGEAKANTSFYGQSVARATWELVINSGKAAATNADVDFTKLEDVVFKVTHEASARQSGVFDTSGASCLAGNSAL